MEDPAPFVVLVVGLAGSVEPRLAPALGEGFRVLAAEDGRAALKLAFGRPSPDLVVLDVDLPGPDGYDVCKALKTKPDLAEVPVILLGERFDAEALARGLSLGAVDFLAKPTVAEMLAVRVRTQAELVRLRTRHEERVRARLVVSEQSRQQFIRRLGRAAVHHEGSGAVNRAVRVGHYAHALARAAGARPQVCDQLMCAAPLYDIGKLAVPADVLRKPGPLDEAARAQLRRYPSAGAELIGLHDDPLLSLARAVALAHRECWDGSGYPAGARGTDIPWAGRVMAVVDAFESLTAPAFGGEAMAAERALQEIEQEAGTRFDPVIVEALKKSLPDMQEIGVRFADVLGDLLSHESPAREGGAALPGEVSDEQAAIDARVAHDLRAGDEARARAAADARAAALARARLEAEAAIADAERRKAQEEAGARAAAEERRDAETRLARIAREALDARASALADAQARREAEEALARAADEIARHEEEARSRAQQAAAAEAQALEAARQRADADARAAEAALARAEAEAASIRLQEERKRLEAESKAAAHATETALRERAAASGREASSSGAAEPPTAAYMERSARQSRRWLAGIGLVAAAGVAGLLVFGQRDEPAHPVSRHVPGSTPAITNDRLDGEPIRLRLEPGLQPRDARPGAARAMPTDSPASPPDPADKSGPAPAPAREDSRAD